MNDSWRRKKQDIRHYALWILKILLYLYWWHDFHENSIFLWYWLRYYTIILQSGNYGTEDCWKELFAYVVETMEMAVKSWHESSTVDPRVYFLLHKEQTDTEKYAPVVNIDKVPSLWQFCSYIHLLFDTIIWNLFLFLFLIDIYIIIDWLWNNYNFPSVAGIWITTHTQQLFFIPEAVCWRFLFSCCLLSGTQKYNILSSGNGCAFFHNANQDYVINWEMSWTSRNYVGEEWRIWTSKRSWNLD